MARRRLPESLYLAASLLVALGCAPVLSEVEPREISFASGDGGTVSADLYEAGTHAVVLAHGAVFDKASWRPLASALAEQELTVLAIDFRGYGKSQPGAAPAALEEDLLGALSYLRAGGWKRASLVGGSMGAAAAGRAAVKAEPGRIDRLVLLAPGDFPTPERIAADSILFIVSAEERRYESMSVFYQRLPEPKRFEVLPGNTHAQHVFKTAQGPALTELIVSFLVEAEGS